MNITTLLEKASELRIAVVGDAMVDKYIIGDVNRISPEAPVPVVNVIETRSNPGGAANVVENLKNIGVQVSFFYNEKHIPEKVRVMADGHHLLRIDHEKPPHWQQWDDIDIGLGYGIQHKKFDCVVLSDYGKGVCSHDVISQTIRLCNEHGIPTVVDTKHKLSRMHHATLVKCNAKEWKVFNDMNDSQWHYLETKDVHHLVITNGANGMQFWSKNGSFELSGDIPGIPVNICDACGAGDTVTAVLTICIAMASDIESMEEACKLANFAAAQVCQHPGVYAIQKQDLMKYGN